MLNTKRKYRSTILNSKSVYTIFLLSSFSLFCYGESTNTKRDSLLSLLGQQEINKSEVYYELFLLYHNADKDAALAYALEGYGEGLRSGDSLWVVKNGDAVGWAYKEMGHYELSIEYYQNAISIAEIEKLTKNLIRLYGGLGNVYVRMQDYDHALEFYFKYLNLAQETQDTRRISIAYNNIGLSYYRIEDYDMSVKYYKEAMRLKERIGVVDNDHLINVGLAYINLEEYDSAKISFSKVIDACEQGCDDQTMMTLNRGMGRVLHKDMEYDSAENYLKRSNEYARKIGDNVYLVLNYTLLARIRYEKADFQKALSYMKSAEVVLVKNVLNNSDIDYFEMYAKVYAKLGDYENAYHNQYRYSVMKDSVMGLEVTKNIRNIQLSFEEERNRKLIQAEKAKVEVSKKLNYLLALFVALFSAFLVALWSNYRQKQKANLQLSDANRIIEEQNNKLKNVNTGLDKKVVEQTKKLQATNEALHQSNKELDTFIYRTSHDIRGPLASLLGLSEVALFDVKDAKALDYFDKLNITAKNLNHILSRVLDITQIKTSSQFDEYIDFNNILEDVLDKQKIHDHSDLVNFRYQLENTLDFYCDPYLVLTIINNLVENGYKFYNSSSRVESFVSVEISKTKDHILIKVIDNGIGIEISDSDKIFEIFSKGAEQPATAGLGLYLVKLAVERLQGKVYLVENEHDLTEFNVLLPLKMGEKVISAA